MWSTCRPCVIPQLAHKGDCRKASLRPGLHNQIFLIALRTSERGLYFFRRLVRPLLFKFTIFPSVLFEPGFYHRELLGHIHHTFMVGHGVVITAKRDLVKFFLGKLRVSLPSVDMVSFKGYVPRHDAFIGFQFMLSASIGTIRACSASARIS